MTPLRTRVRVLVGLATAAALVAGCGSAGASGDGSSDGGADMAACAETLAPYWAYSTEHVNASIRAISSDISMTTAGSPSTIGRSIGAPGLADASDLLQYWMSTADTGCATAALKTFAVDYRAAAKQVATDTVPPETALLTLQSLVVPGNKVAAEFGLDDPLYDDGGPVGNAAPRPPGPTG